MLIGHFIPSNRNVEALKESEMLATLQKAGFELEDIVLPSGVVITEIRCEDGDR